MTTPWTRAVEHVWWPLPSGDIPMCQRCPVAWQMGPGTHTEYLWVGFAVMFWGLQQGEGEQRPSAAPLSHLPPPCCCLRTSFAGLRLGRAIREQGQEDRATVSPGLRPWCRPGGEQSRLLQASSRPAPGRRSQHPFLGLTTAEETQRVRRWGTTPTALSAPCAPAPTSRPSLPHSSMSAPHV